MRRALLLAALAAAAAVPARAFAEGEKIVEIDVIDNTKTDDETVKLIAGVDKGDHFTFALAEEIKNNLQQSGLFKDDESKVFTTPVPEKNGVRLTIQAKEKMSWVVGPTFYNQPGNTGGGLGFAESNLWGRNKKLLGYAQIATADSLFLLGYLDPAIYGSAAYFRIDTFLRHEKVTEYTSPTELFSQPEPARISTVNYLNAGFLFGVNLWRGLALDGRLRGARVFFDDPHCDPIAAGSGACVPSDPMGADPLATRTPEDDGWDVSTEAKLSNDNRANWHGVQTGHLFQLSYETGLPQLGSDYDYWYAGGRFVLGKKFYKEHNLLLKTGVGYGRRLPFQQEYSSGGAPGLRGYISRQFRGNAKASGTLEYSLRLFRVGPLFFRGLAFWDTAFTTFYNTDPAANPQRHYLPGQLDTKVSQLRNGVGAGFRVYIKSIVLPLVGVDVGYGVEANDYHVYLAVGLVEL